MANRPAAKPFGIIDVVAKNPGGQIVPAEQIVPLEIVLELPAPPSINRNSASARLGNEAPKVKRWRKAAEAHLVFTRQHRKLGKPVTGEFEIQIIWDNSIRGDIDNRIKYLLDVLQRWRVYINDGDCRLMAVRYGDVMADGCRVRLRPWDQSS